MHLIRSLRKRLLRKYGQKRVARRFDSLWELDPKDWIDLRMIVRQPFKEQQMAKLHALCAELQPDTFLDCGANFGFYTVRIAMGAPSMEVHAFEPVSTTRAKLERNLAQNALQDRVTVHGVALSNREGTAKISIDPSSSGLSTLAPDDEAQRHRDYSYIETVPTAGLDDTVPLQDRRIAIKMDVEGFELTALEGMVRTLQSNEAVVQIETRPANAERLDARMLELGYRFRDAIGEDRYYTKS